MRAAFLSSLFLFDRSYDVILWKQLVELYTSRNQNAVS